MLVICQHTNPYLCAANDEVCVDHTQNTSAGLLHVFIVQVPLNGNHAS